MKRSISHLSRSNPKEFNVRSLFLVALLAPVLLLGASTNVSNSAALNVRAVRGGVSDKTVRPAAGPLTLLVNTLGDAADTNVGDGLCDIDAGASGDQCTLRAAVQETNAATTGDDAINFSLAASSIIVLNTPLPDINGSLSINGPGANTLTVQRSSSSFAFRIFNVTVTSPGVVTISGLTITNGLVSGPENGGGINNQSTGTVNVTNSTLTNNRTSPFISGGGGDGAGIYNSAGTVNVISSTLNANVAPSGLSSIGFGGGIYNNAGTVSITNSTLSHNSARAGGGILNLSGELRVINSTISNNSASRPSNGGGIQNSTGSVQIKNSIVALNTNSDGNPDLSGSFTTQGHNLIGVNNGTGFTPGTNNPNGDLVGTSASPINPLLGTLSNYGGSMMTIALLPGSPAIDAGDNCIVLAAGSGGCLTTPLTTDQRGFGRQVNSTVDIGAFESRGFSITSTSGTPQSATISGRFNSSLVATVSSAFAEPVAGGRLKFTAPTSGASATFADSGTNTVTVTLDGGGAGNSTPVNANNHAGSYQVSAGASGILSLAVFNLTNNKAPTSTSITSSANPSDLGQSVTFTATTISIGGVPTGAIQFYIDGVASGAPVALNASGGATLTTSALTAGTHTIAADYPGNADFIGSTGFLSQMVRSQPSLSVNDVSVTEGDTGTKALNFTITLSAASNLTVTANFATANGTATAGSDYQSNSGVVTFNPGQTNQTIAVTLNGDQNFEPDETLFVNLSSPANATISRAQGTGVILNDDAQGGVINFSQSNYSVSESGGFVNITVNRANDTSRAATVDYATSDGSAGTAAQCATVNGLASARCDFTNALGTLRFAAGEASKTFTVLISQDNYVEGPETLTLSLSNLTGGALFGVPATAVLTINDDATEPATNVIDDVRNFVRQHYHDFLNREPDTSGWDFWTNQITSCGNDVQCNEVRRIDVSASFFLSIEFQQTGYFVERFYKTSYGDASGTSNFQFNHQLPVPVVRFSEFLKDTQRIGQGVIVLQPGWEQALENNKQAYALEFVQTSRFTTAFPTSMIPGQLVDALFANTGVTPSALDRTAAINEFGAATTTSDTAARARALRRIAENPTFIQQEFNRAFVLMEYFGYLGRNPNDAPESTLDYTGYDFWLTKLNQFNGNYINAEMVKAFLSSIEYRQRFGP
jgi:Calx-beta domain-containing protein/Big-like domain-containing protein/uncharacterized protein DUF4214